MIQIVLEFLAWIGLDYVDYKHRKKISKKEEEDGIKRPFQKYALQPGFKVFMFVIVLVCLSSFLFFTYQRHIVFPKSTKDEISEISNWIEKWNGKFGYYPQELKEIIGNNPMRQDWDKDAWNKDYKYIVNESKKTFFITSAGKDGQFDTQDDISSQ